MKITTTLIMALIASTILFGQTHKENLKITHLTGDFYVFTTYREYRGTLFPSNGLYLVTDSGVVMIDTPWDSTQFQPLLDSIRYKHKQKVLICIATHSHEDRTGGLEYYRQKGIKTLTTFQTESICRERNEERAEFLFSKDSTFRVGQYSFQTFYAGQGHTPDNIVIWFYRAKILYGGCLVKSMEANDLGNLNDANTDEWETTIRTIQKKFGNPKYIIPGHQGWTSNKSLDHTLRLLEKNKKENHS